MSEIMISMQNVDTTPANENIAAYTYTSQTQSTHSNIPVVLCGWCGTEEQYISNQKTICPNCGE